MFVGIFHFINNVARKYHFFGLLDHIFADSVAFLKGILYFFDFEPHFPNALVIAQEYSFLLYNLQVSIKLLCTCLVVVRFYCIGQFFLFFFDFSTVLELRVSGRSPPPTPFSNHGTLPLQCFSLNWNCLKSEILVVQ